MTYSVRTDLSTNNEDIETLYIETINAKSKNILVNTSYRRPAGRYNKFKIYLKQFLYKSKKKKSDPVGDLNLNLLGHRSNTKIKDYLSLTFQNFLIPVINKPTRITKTISTLNDHILTNDFVNTDNSMGITKSEISDHFTIFLITIAQFFNNIRNKTIIRKREINEKCKQYFKEILSEVNWNNNLVYEYFYVLSMAYIIMHFK